MLLKINHYGEYIDTVGIDETSLCTTFNDSKPDAGDYFEADLEAKKILDILLQLLSDDQVIAINSVTLGNGSLGHTCHHELAEISHVSTQYYYKKNSFWSKIFIRFFKKQ